MARIRSCSNRSTFLAKLAALVPRPHKNTIVHHGVLSPHARLRERVIAYRREERRTEPDTVAATSVPEPKRKQWTELMRRAFGYELLRCTKCGGKMQLLGCIIHQSAIAKILSHLGLPCESPIPALARASP